LAGPFFALRIDDTGPALTALLALLRRHGGASITHLRDCIQSGQPVICTPLFGDWDDEFSAAMQRLLAELDEIGVSWSAFELMSAEEWDNGDDHFTITRSILDNMIATRRDDLARMQQLDDLGHR